jgi:hypothetical protein
VIKGKKFKMSLNFSQQILVENSWLTAELDLVGG